MNRRDSRNLKAGQFIKTGYRAFLPAPLPPKISWSLPLVTALSDAERELGKLTTTASNFRLPWLLIQPFIRQEAVLSSRIEGMHASLMDLYAYEAEQMPFIENPDDVREVHNYVRALNHGLDRLKKLPVSLRLIREVHRKLMENVHGGMLTPGEFRGTQNWIGPAGASIQTATFVPPPPDKMQTALYGLKKFIHAGSDLPDLIRAGLIHYQFEAIHPFLDGNGRVGRLLMILLFCEWGILPQPLLNLSVYFERYRQEYYDHLLSVSQHGTWEEWLRFFLRGVSTQAEESLHLLTRLEGLRAKYQVIADEERNPKRMEQALDFLFTRPVLTVRQLENGLGTTYTGAKRYMEKLVEAGILQEMTGYARNRIFRADEIYKAFEVGN